jgi:predicted HAD superfamily Cof-like phosphohydrolase
MQTANTQQLILHHLLQHKEVMMTNPFEDIERFGTACDQPASEANYKMYLSLIDEEVSELVEAVAADDKVEQLDALIDILVVTMGAVRAAGWDGEAAWKEVMDTNFAKIDPDTGKVRKREDGKVLKPEGWKAPELAKFI